MQTVGAALGEPMVGDTGEDCLSLNVWTPAPDDRRRPVLVWFHGGAFLFGAGSSYDGAALARRGDVVVVTVNYRLGSSAGCAESMSAAKRCRRRATPDC